jgi:hypothetical protein
MLLSKSFLSRIVRFLYTELVRIWGGYTASTLVCRDMATTHSGHVLEV